MERSVNRPKASARPLREDRPTETTKNREGKEKTRLDPTTMAHAQHNRKNPELDKRMKLTEEALSESAISDISSALN